MIRHKIDPFHFEDITNELHPSVFFKHDEYDLLILRIPKEDGEKVTAQNQAFIITPDKYYHFDAQQQRFIDLGDIKGFYRVLDSEIDETMKLVMNYTQKVESIEDAFYEGRSVQGFSQKWILFKNSLIRINRVIYKAHEVFRDLTKQYSSESDYLETNFQDILEHLARAHRNSEHLIQKLDALYDFYTTTSNEQMNKTVYVLTLLSGIFLPLNLLVGFFGMNTTSLPFTEEAGGTLKVITLLLVVGAISALLTYFIKKR